VTGGVCVVGSINVDTTLRVRTLPGPGETVLASERRTAHGGKGANQAAAAGEGVAFVGTVGTDEQGDAALENLARRGVDVVGVARDPDHPTGSAVVVVSMDGNNLIVVDPGANAGLRPDWVSSHVERLGPAVILGQLEVPVEALTAAVRAAPHAMFVLNPAPMPADRATVGELVSLADVLVPNRTELGQLAGSATPSTDEEVDLCAVELRFDGLLVVTLGEAGAAVYDQGVLLQRVPATPVTAVDTSGAGDAFCGALARGLAADEPLSSAVSTATRVAGESTRHPGAQLPFAL
jgi:ribokinase